MSAYAVPPLEQLKEQVLYAPKRVRVEQTARAEQLLDQIEDSRRYPYEWVCYRITKYRPSNGTAPVTYLGADIKRDLVRFIEEVSASADLRPDMFDEPVLFIEDLTRQHRISGKTVSRWRRRGLVGRLFRTATGRRRVGFLKSSVDRFVSSNRVRVARSERFSHLDEAEREEIIRRARRMARLSRCSMSDIARHLAAKMGRAPETIRYTIRNYDRTHPQDAIFRTDPARLDAAQRDEIYRSFARGVPVATLARRFGRTTSSIYRVINECRARLLLDLDLSYIDSPEFTAPDADARCLGEMPDAAPADRLRKTMRAPAGLPPYLAQLYEVPLLTREQEVHLFRKMNYLKYKASKLREKLDPRRATSAQLQAIQKLVDEALEIKNQIIRANLRLVVSIAKRHVGRSANFFELVSDGNMSLIRAVDKFNYWLGNKFSTYASWAIMKNFARTIPEENYRQGRFVTGLEEMFETAADTREDGQESETSLARVKESLQRLLVRLEDRERQIIISRFGLGDSQGPATLEQVGNHFGVTKERIRQIEARALMKLKKLADEQKIDLNTLGE